MPTIIYHQMCFSLPRRLWMLIDAIIGFDQHSHTHALSLSSLRYLALFPHLSVLLKSPLSVCLIINWNTDFTVLGCSHFKGSINTKSTIEINVVVSMFVTFWNVLNKSSYLLKSFTSLLSIILSDRTKSLSVPLGMTQVWHKHYPSTRLCTFWYDQKK